MWRFHQETRIAFCYTVKTRWKSVLQLQSVTPGTLQCYRGSETVGKKPPKSSLSLRLPFSIAVLDLWNTRCLTEETSGQHQWVGPVNEGCSAVDPCSYRHNGQWNRRSVGKGRQKKRSAFLTSVIQRNKNSYPQEAKIHFHCFNWWIQSTKCCTPPTVSPRANNNISSKDRSMWTKRTSKKNWYSASPRLYVIVGKMIKHQITSCSHVHSTTEKGDTSDVLVPQWMPIFGALQMIYIWQPILRP